jgi:hypothetical protein
MSDPIKTAIDFTLDLEVNRLAKGASQVPNRNSDGSIIADHKLSHKQVLSESHVVPSEVAYINNATNKLTAVTIDNLTTPKFDLDISRTYDISSVFKGNKVPTKLHAAQVQTREDINDLFLRKNKKGKTLTSRQRDHFFDKIYPEIKSNIEKKELFYEHALADQKQIIHSSFSKKFFEETAINIHTQSVNSVVKHIPLDATKSGVLEWEQFKAQFVNEFAGTIIDAANQKGFVNIGAWNAQFESDRLAGWIHNYADPRIKQKWFSLVANKNIKFIGMESSYIDVMYGFSKGNKDLVSRIPLRADTFQEFGYRAGAVASNYDEFATAIPWSQDLVTGSMAPWHTKLGSMAGAEAHHAPIDVLRANAAKDFFDKVKIEAVRLAREKDNNLTYSTWEHFIDSQGKNANNLMHDAFENVTAGEGFAAKGDASKAIVKQFVDKISKAAKQKNSATEIVMSSISRGGRGGGLPPGGVIGDIKALSKGHGWRYGTLAAAAGLAVAATYFETSDYSNNKYGSSFGKIGKVQSKITQFDDLDDIGDGPFVPGHALKFALSAGATVGALGLIGLREAKMRSPLLGVADNFKFQGATAREMFTEAGKLVRTGIDVVEGHFPITRVFKAGQLWDYLSPGGNRRGGRLAVPLHDLYNPKKVGSVNIDKFMHEASIANDANTELLRNVINDQGRLRSLKRSTMVMVKTKDGKTKVSIFDVDHSDNVTSPDGFGEAGMEFDVDSVFSRMSRANPAGRGVSPGKRRIDDAFNRMRNSLNEDAFASQQTRFGNSRRLTFREYLTQFTKPTYMNEQVYEGYKYMTYMLDIGPKGIHLGRDVFTDSPRSLGSVKASVGVNSIGGAGTVLDNMRLKAERFGQVGKEFLQAGNRFLESPFEIFINPQTIHKTIHHLKGSGSSVKHIAGSILEKLDNTHLGLNINNMKYGSIEYLGKFALKRVLPLGVAYYGVKTIDSLLGAATFSPTGRGPLTSIPNKIYQTGALAYSKVSDILGLTTIAKRQEEYAPGSTGLGILAFPAAIAGSYSMADMIYKKSPQHFQGLINKFGNAAMNGNVSGYNHGSLTAAIASKFHNNSIFQEALRVEAFPGALNKSIGARVVNSFIKRPKLSLFAAASTLLLPFLPGVLGSTKTYDERKAEFAGQKDVAIRKNRGWMLSSQAFQGGGVGQYRQHGSYLYGSNFENRGVIWPSYSSRLLHAATFGLANRYVLEEYHKESQPVYETSPYGASVPVIGPLISSTIGRIVKPIRRMHDEYTLGMANLNIDSGYSDNYKYIAQQSYSKFSELGTKKNFTVSTNTLPTGMTINDVSSVGSMGQSMAQLSNQVNDLVGFKGFAFETVMRTITGKQSYDQYTPYLKSAQEMYNPSQYMWQYQAGDFSVIGGEFLRRGLVKNRDRWEINDIPNELSGQKWIPERFQSGTTFDQMPMGWLYASRKGWEFTYPEIRNMPMDQYPDEIKLDILKYMAPYSAPFKTQLEKSTRKALSGQLSPFEEQRVYEAAEQEKEIQKRVNAHGREASYNVDMEQISARITSFNMEDMTFTTDQGDTRYKLAGVTAAESQIRAGLLKKNKYSSAEDLQEDALKIQQNIIDKVQSGMQVGSTIKFSTPGNGNFSGGMPEAVVGSLNQDLLSAGSPLLDTGNVSKYNLKQDQEGPGSGLLSSYWNLLTDSNNLFKNKLIGNKDYITEYKQSRVTNLDVKLWSRPIEHFLKPIIASAMENIGINLTPSFTKERRKNEQYWDVIKYIKYKTLATRAEYGDNAEMAEQYRQLAESTMVGSDPISNPAAAKAAMPIGDRDYFQFFANEPDPKRRGKIFGLLSSPQKRIYNAIWTAKVANSGTATSGELEKYRELQETGGYEIDDNIRSDWEHDTGKQGSLKDYVRARYVQEYISKHNVPGSDWAGWDAQVNIDNVALQKLEASGQQVEDYGYFDEQKRSAAYDKLAYLSTQQMNSTHLSKSEFIGTMLPALVSGSGMDTASGMPTMSQFPISSSTIQSDSYSNSVYRAHQLPSYASGGIASPFMSVKRLVVGG